MEHVPLDQMQTFIEMLYSRHFAVPLQSFEQRLRAFFILIRQTTCYYTRVLFHLRKSEPIKSGLEYLMEFAETLFKQYPVVRHPHPLTNDHYVFSVLQMIVNNKQDLVNTVMLLAKTETDQQENETHERRQSDLIDLSPDIQFPSQENLMNVEGVWTKLRNGFLKIIEAFRDRLTKREKPLDRGIRIAKLLEQQIDTLLKRFDFAVPIYSIIQKKMNSLSSQQKKIQNTQEYLRSNFHVQEEYELVFQEFIKKHPGSQELLSSINSHSFVLIQVLTQIESMLMQPILLAQMLTARAGKQLLQGYFSSDRYQCIQRVLLSLNRFRQEEIKLLEINENQVLEVFEWLFRQIRLARELNKWLKSKSADDPLSSETSSDVEEAPEEESKTKYKGITEKKKKVIYPGLELLLEADLFKEYVRVYRDEVRWMNSQIKEGAHVDEEEGLRKRKVYINGTELQKLFDKSRPFYRMLKFQTEMDISFKRLRMEFQSFCMSEFKTLALLQHNFKL